MILQALYALAEREGLTDDLDFEPKRIAWLVRVSPEGKLLSINGTHFIPPEEEKKKKPRPVARTFIVPRQPQKVGQKGKPGYLVDNALYVFGKDLQDKRFSPEQAAERAEWFREETEKWLEETQDEGVKAVCQFLNDVWNGRQKIELPEDCKPNDLFAFVYDPDIDQLVTDRPAVRQYWKERRRSQSMEDSRFLCLVSGQKCLPGLFPKVKVPGGNPAGVGFVSYNKPAFCSYGWNEKARNANGPISRTVSEACATALSRLLNPAYPDPHQPGQTLPQRNLHLSADTSILYWAAESVGEDFCSVFGGLLESNPEQVKALYQSIWKGRSPGLEDPSVFYALTISGSQGRAIVRDWFESTVEKTAQNLTRHFDDLAIVRNTPKPKKSDLRPQIPLTLLLESLAPGGDRAQVPSHLIGGMVKAALHGTPYPYSILGRAIERTRAEIGRSQWTDQNRRDARAALIKAVLNRRQRLYPENTNYEEVKPHMDPKNDSPGYSLGILMAVLERLQQTAQGDVNATVVDRYFSSASATPKIAFVRLMKNARHHVRKVKDDSKKRGMVYRLERLMDDLAERFDPENSGFPAHLDLEQQGLFVLGYHQMRRWLWMNKEERTQWEKDHADAPRVFFWTKEENSNSNNENQGG